MKLTTNTNKSQRGFTLIEMLVVVFIMALLSSISIANFRNGERHKRVAIAVDTVTNAIRSAQNYTLSGKEISDPSNPTCRRPIAYFTRITDAGVITLYGVTSCATVAIETYPLPVATQIQANGLKINGATGGNSYLDIRFTAPFALVTAGGNVTSQASFTEATITLESTQASITDMVLVDGVSGRIGE